MKRIPNAFIEWGKRAYAVNIVQARGFTERLELTSLLVALIIAR